MSFPELIGFLIVTVAFLILSGKKPPQRQTPNAEEGKREQQDRLKKFLSSLGEEEEEEEEEYLPPPPPPLPVYTRIPEPPRTQLPKLIRQPLLLRMEKAYHPSSAYETIRLGKLNKGRVLVDSITDWKKQILIKEILGPPKGF